MGLNFTDKEQELFTALDLQAKLYDKEKTLEERERSFNAKLYELETEKQRTISEHGRFKLQNGEETHRLSK